jgi:hypothetical protein
MAASRKNSKPSTADRSLSRAPQRAPSFGRRESRAAEGSPSPSGPKISPSCVSPEPRWDACLTGQKRYVHFDEAQQAERRDRAKRAGKSAEEVDALEEFIVVSSRFVEIHREGCEPVRFRINRRKGRQITFTDRRECETGSGGTTGLWGTRPAMPAGLPRSLAPTAFKAELGRLVGIETVEQIFREIMQGDFFSTKKRQT